MKKQIESVLITKSDRDKKLKAVFRDKEGKKIKTTHFGAKGMSDFTKHKDPKRRKNYLERSGGIRNKEGKLTKNDKNSANYYARRYLWNA